MQFENVVQQRLRLDEIERQLLEQRKTAEAQHVVNMERIDSAINQRVAASPGAPLGESPSAASSLDSPMVQVVGQGPMPSQAQVLSETLGRAVSDPSFLANVPAEHRTVIKQFCAQVTSAFAASLPVEAASAAESPASATSMDVSESDDMNPHNAIGHIC